MCQSLEQSFVSVRALTHSNHPFVLPTLYVYTHTHMNRAHYADIDLVHTAKGKEPYEVTISPDQCCLEIAQNDIDCHVS